MRKFILMWTLLCSVAAFAQQKPEKELRFNFNEEGTHYLKATFTAQIWGRYTENNPGTTVYGFEKKDGFDIGLRRVRAQLFGKIHDKVFFYSQFGINNFNSIAARKAPVFFHDVLAEYYVTPRTLQTGMGLTAWTGFSRFSSPAVASIMGFDAPLFQQATNDATDQFLRKLSVYAKGKLGRLDYRLIVSDPFAAQNSLVVNPIGVNADFSFKPAKLQKSAYLMYQFHDEESNLTPYMTGTYLGKKKVFNIGAGVQYQPDAMWRWNDAVNKDTISEDMLLIAADVYYDHPVGKDGAAISLYGCFTQMGFGKNYLRNLGVMNPANGVKTGVPNFNGGGNAYPMMGTGQVLFAQAGYLLPKGKVMPYVMYTRGNFERLQQVSNTYDAGLNYFIDGHRSKIALNYQNRPVFNFNTLKEYSRRSMLLLQLQIAI